MRYILRADASQSIGAGHVMRSSAIAEELIARGEEVVFIGQTSELPWVEERISSLGFTHVYTESNDFIPKCETDVLLLDTYKIHINDKFLEPKNWLHIIAIVDELTPNYRCTLRIHPGLDSYWVGSSKVPILAGPKYIPFRSSLSKNMHKVNQEPHTFKIAVVGGGSDPFGLVHKVANILVTISEEFEVYLFSNTTPDPVLDSRFHYIEVGHLLDELTKSVDLVLTTASTSSLEFMARGLCVGVVCVIDNQEQYYKAIGNLGVAAQLGIRTMDNHWELDKEKICSLITSRQLRESLLANAAGLIDFKGASRIVDEITKL
jgi:spore coat polysaccharide biosynthesis predicted glycosyltransferase SpsG